MGQLGISEIILIFAIALLVFGPKKLPELGKSLGKGLCEFKKATEDIKSNWDEHLKEVEKSVEDVKGSVNQAAKEIVDHTLMSESNPPNPAPTNPTPAPETKAAEDSEKEVHQT